MYNEKYSNAARVISSILKHDQKVNSYKIALLRAINDVVLDFPDLVDYGQDIAVPIKVLAECWISYYWPFMNPERPIYQGPRALRKGVYINDVSFRPELEMLYFEWQKMLNTLDVKPSDGFYIRNEMRIARKLREYSIEFIDYYNKAIKKISSAISMPIRYAGDGQWQVFGIPKKPSELEGITFVPGTNQKDLCVVISKHLWQGFHQISLYIEALAIHQWSLFLENVKQENNKKIKRGSVYQLLTARPDNRRPLTWERNHIDVLIMEGLQFRCPWTKKIINNPGAYDLDHIIPISLYPINELWNLVPCDSIFNSKGKRERLPNNKSLDSAIPVISETYSHYLRDSGLSDALREDANSRFVRISSEGFSIQGLTFAVKNFIISVQKARNIATF